MRVIGFLRALRACRRGALVLPRFLTYLVTFRCNARCVMCDSWRKAPGEELALPEIEAIFRQLPRLDALRLSGGEPFLRADLPEIAALATRYLRPLSLHVTTNGLLTERIVSFCEGRARTTPLRLLVSLDGLEAQHNAVRGVARAWEMALATLRALAPRQRELHLRLAINQTIVDAASCAQYRALREAVRPLGVQHQVVIAYDESATYSTAHAHVAAREAGGFRPFGALPAEALDALFEELAADLPTLSFLDRVCKRYYYRGLRNRLLAQHAAPNPRCVALRAHLRMYPNGDVPVCQFNATRAGNLRETPFAALWPAARTAHLRQWVDRCPGCWAECEVLPNAIYSGEILREITKRR